MAAQTEPTGRKWWTLGVVSVATFMLLLDITVVNTALPAIEDDLDASFTDLQWVIDAYTLSLAAVVLMAGPLVGGALVDSLGWESIFFLNVPIGVAAIAITYARVRETRDPNATGVDWLGVATFSSSLFLLVLALLRGNQDGWGSPLIVGLFAAAAVLLAAFVMIERKVAGPMLPLGFFKRPAFTGVQIAAVGVSASMFALFLYF